VTAARRQLARCATTSSSGLFFVGVCVLVFLLWPPISFLAAVPICGGRSGTTAPPSGQCRERHVDADRRHSTTQTGKRAKVQVLERDHVLLLQYCTKVGCIFQVHALYLSVSI